MSGGTLIVSREEKLFGTWKMFFDELGFHDVVFTKREMDGLNAVIEGMRPDVVFIGSKFYGLSTPYMLLDLIKAFPWLNVAAVNIYDFTDDLAMYFIVNGAKSYINLFEGMDEFKKGLAVIRDGGGYISQGVKERIALRPELPMPAKRISGRQLEVLKLGCRGFSETETGLRLKISRRTVISHRANIFKSLNIRNGNEMLRAALNAGLITNDELNELPTDYTVSPKPEKRAGKKTKAGREK